MWFCCQLWQCNLQTCLGPLDMWKAWNGWTHVVYPSKAHSAATFLNSRIGEEHSKHSMCLQRQVPARNLESPPPSGFAHPSTDRVECEVAVEIHPGPVTPDDSHSQTSSSRSSPCEPPAGVALRQHRYSAEPVSGVSSPLGVVLEWEPEEQEDDDEEEEEEEEEEEDDENDDDDDDDDDIDDQEEKDVTRAPSTDWTALESSLDFWQLEHSRRPPPNEDEPEPFSKVNVENLIEYYVDDDISMASDTDRESLRSQYRQIWELRATLEEDEGLSDPGRICPKQSDVESMSRSSPDQSPEIEAANSHATSFESNTEPLLEDPSRWPPHLLHLPYEIRRQTYRDILNLRLRRLEARKQQTTQPRHPSVEDTSFESVETVDTEGSSTDASRLEQATSFESTTDNTDSTGEGQAHRLQQLRADSGYRSLENPPVAAPKLSRRQLPVADSADLDGVVPPATKPNSRPPSTTGQSQETISLGDTMELDSNTKSHGLRLMSLGDSGSCDLDPLTTGTTNVSSHMALGDSSEPEHDEGVAGLQSPPSADKVPTDGRRKSCGRSASKKRREFGSGRGATVLMSTTDLDQQNCHSTRTYSRDYSVDEKSDALFREFSRCDPAQSELMPRQRLGGSGYRHHSRHTHYPSYPYPYPGPARKFSESRTSIDEEYSLALSLPLRYADDDGQLATLPIIRVADEDSSDQM